MRISGLSSLRRSGVLDGGRMQSSQQLLANELSRRQFVGRGAMTGAGLLGLSGLLAGCGSGSGVVGHSKAPAKELDFANWPLYIDRSVLHNFQRIFGTKVVYREEINDNQDYFLRFAADLRGNRPIGRDLVVLTSWMAARWVREGYVEPIDKRNVPNAGNLRKQLQNPSSDPGRRFTLPWQAGITAIGYNPKKTGRKLHSVNDLFDPAFKGKVTLFSESVDSASFVLLGTGKRLEDATLDDLLESVEKMDQEVRKGQIRRFVGNEYTADLVKGDTWISLAYSGDILQLKQINPDLEFLIPEEGAILWSDEMLIPKGAAHPYAAEVMMNYAYDSEVAARITRFVKYVTPVSGAYEEVKQVDPKLARNELIFPSDETLNRLHGYAQLTPKEEDIFNAAMAKVVRRAAHIES